jgi:hypothetical protein
VFAPYGAVGPDSALATGTPDAGALGDATCGAECGPLAAGRAIAEGGELAGGGLVGTTGGGLVGAAVCERPVGGGLVGEAVRGGCESG